jgi:hypothetical protein
MGHSLVQHLDTNTDLAAMFDIEMADDVAAPTSPPTAFCGKCKGKGKFYSYTGRAVGNCFACNGTGLDRMACIEVKEGDCTKCGGSGEWRPGRPCFACNSTGKVAGSQNVDISVEAIATAFAAATQHGIAAPKLRLGTFLFSLAPNTGRNAGAIYVKTAASREYLGKVIGGKFSPTLACDAVTKAEVVAVAADPANAAKAYGQRTNKCSCCGRTLTNGDSVDLGIGPICAEKFGW